jgi:hypothetical protein
MYLLLTMSTITYDQKNNTLHYIRENNEYISKCLYNILLYFSLDICKLISTYHYNGLMVNVKKSYAVDLGIDISIAAEYIDFKEVTHQGLLWIPDPNWKYGWYLSNKQVNKPTILKDNCYNVGRSIYGLNKYMKQKYKINNYFSEYYKMSDLENIKFIISDNAIIYTSLYNTHEITILDHTLFRYLIEIIKEILITHYQKLQ